MKNKSCEGASLGFVGEISDMFARNEKMKNCAKVYKARKIRSYMYRERDTPTELS